MGLIADTPEHPLDPHVKAYIGETKDEYSLEEYNSTLCSHFNAGFRSIEGSFHKNDETGKNEYYE